MIILTANKTNIGSIIISVLAIAVICCNCGQESHEDRIKRTINKISNLIEAKKLDPLLIYLSDEYSDNHNRNFAEIREMITKYFTRYSGIAVNILATRILFINFPDAETETDAAFSSGAARAFRKIIRYSGEQYRIKLKFRYKDNIWQVFSAEWRYVGLDELFPESFKLLKKIFPTSF